jgi:acetoin utilization deacetylase AcuC-like enzyme
MQHKPVTGIVYDQRYAEHRTADGHPENFRRLQAIYKALDKDDHRGRFVRIEPRAATPPELELVHSPDYVVRIAATESKPYTALTADTHASAGSYKAAALAAGGLLEAVERVVSGRLQNAFALIRPPGHHAEKSRAMGFCLFNNIALAACFARRIMGLQRILIFDWDVHHGNGTQHIFEDDPAVLFFSIHQYPHFPGTGFFTEAGRGRGEGYTVNIPLSKGYGDGDYVMLVRSLLRPVALEFDPDLILVSAGFDIHRSDPMGGMRLTRHGFAGLTRSIMEIADACCRGRIVMALEGGYNTRTIGSCVKATIDELSGRTATELEPLAAKADPKKIDYVFKRCIRVQQRFWPVLGRNRKNA